MIGKKFSHPPYRPSWQNRFFDAVDRSPLPNLLIYILIFAVLFTINHLAAWVEGKLPWGQWDQLQFENEIWILLGMIAFDYFISYSKIAIAQVRPALKVNAQEFERLRYRFINMSSREGWLITLGATLIFLVSIPTPGFLPEYQRSGFLLLLILITSVILGSFVFGFFWYLFRNLRMIRDVFGQMEVVNIFHLEPVYAFSGFTSRVAIFFILATTLTFLFNVVLAQQPELGVTLAFSSIYLILALAAFIWPLGGIRSKLQKERERVNAENDRRIQAAYKELHRRMDGNKTKGLSDFRNGLSALLDLRMEIKKISTWPWDTATLRAFITALFVPLVVWLIQQLILRTVTR